MSLGIANPLLRVIVWLAGCLSLSLSALVAGMIGSVLVGMVLVAMWADRLEE